MPALIPSSSRRLGTHLFDLQMWLWGQDVRHPEMNALLRYGFERHPCPGSDKSGSAYVWQRDRKYIALWAFGLFVGHEQFGSLFLKRFQFAPKLGEASQLQHMCWEPSALPRMESPKESDCSTLSHLLQIALMWIVDYEQWAQNLLSVGYRRRCVASWHKVQTPAEAIVPTWQKLAIDLQTHFRSKGNRTIAI